MNTTMKKQSRKPQTRTPVNVIVAHEFIGDKTLAEAFIPVILEDLRHKLEQARTLDNQCDSA